MNFFRYISSISRKGLLLVVGTLVAIGSTISFPARVALAAPPDPQDYVNANSLKRAQKWLNQQQTNVNRANALVTDYQNLITEAEWQSIDTTAISSALATFQSQLNTANSFLSTAANVLSTHNGFDDNGKVIDRVAANQTIKNANLALQNARDLLMHSGKDFKSALNSWEKTYPLVVRIENLQVAYGNNQAWCGGQMTNLGKADIVVANVQNLILAADKKKMGTGALSVALTAFKAQLTIAQSSHASAADDLSAHTGFDDTGNVTNVNDASQTVHDSGLSLLNAHNALGRSSGNLLRALEQWQAQKGIKTTASIYPVYILAHDSTRNLYNSVHVEDASNILNLDTRLNNLLQAFAKVP